MLVHDVESYKKGRRNYSIKFNLLGKGDLRETRFVIGKIIMDTMSSRAVQGGKDVEEEKDHLHTLDPEYDEVDVSTENCDLAISDVKMQHDLGEEDKKRCSSPSNTELPHERAKKPRLIGKTSKLSEDGKIKKQKAVAKTEIEKIVERKHEMGENSKIPEVQKLVKKEAEIIKNEITKEQQGSCNLPLEKLILTQANVPENVTEEKQKIVVNGKCQERFQKHLNVVKGKKYEPREKVNKALLNSVEKRHSPQSRSHQQEGVLEEKNRLIHQNKETTKKNEKRKQDVTKEKPNGRFLSSLFR